MSRNVDKYLKRVKNNNDREKLLRESILLSGYFNVNDLEIDDHLNFCIDMTFNPKSTSYAEALITSDIDTVIGKIVCQILDIMIVSSRLFPKLKYRYEAFKVAVNYHSDAPGESWQLGFWTHRDAILKIKLSREFKEHGIKNKEVITSWLKQTNMSTYKEPVAQEMLA